MTLTHRLATFIVLLVPAAFASQPAAVAPAAAGHAAMRVALPVTAAYHTTAKSRVTARHANAKLATRKTGRRRRVRRIVWNPLLPGSHESQLKQNQEIDEAGLPRIQNDDELDELIAREELIALGNERHMLVSPNVHQDRRYARPVVKDFLDDLGRAYYEQFHQPIQVTSAVRTAEQQHKLRRRNRNAAPESGEAASSHLSGLTVDLAKRGMTKKQHSWLENYLAGLKAANVIEPLEERRQACFHVMVFERYADWRDGKLTKAEMVPVASSSEAAPAQPETPAQPPR